MKKADEDLYQEGVEHASAWISMGGNLMRDPPRRGEAYENWFCDTLASERSKNSGSEVQHNE